MTALRRLRLTVEYDGTDFDGFQAQVDDRTQKPRRTVQEVLEIAIRKLSGEECRIHGAGRTDAGVHALGQVVHFDTHWTVPAERAGFALNGILPNDLVVQKVGDAEPDFHARFSATARVYRYAILNRTAPSALLGRYALHVRAPLDLRAMRAAAAELVGTHDFAAFGKPNQPGQITERHVYGIDIRPWRKDCVLITVRGNAFLRSMVRAFVGTLVFVGRDKLTGENVRAIRESRDRTKCPSLAPARGLCLVRVEYDGTRWKSRLTNFNEELSDDS